MKDKLVAVKWFDACEKNIDDDMLEAIYKLEDGTELFAINTTYGRIIKKLESCTVVMTEDSTSDKDVTIIPNSLIISIK